MRLDDRICYCHDVSLRKLVNFARRRRPRYASQFCECLNAGTGCGWCIPILKRIHDEVLRGRDFGEGSPIDGLPDSADEYSKARDAYRKAGQRNTF